MEVLPLFAERRVELLADRRLATELKIVGMQAAHGRPLVTASITLRAGMTISAPMPPPGRCGWRPGAAA